MVEDESREFPAALAAALAGGFDYDDGNGVDFEPFPEFLSAGETAGWFRSWTGNQEVDGACFRVFGQDGTGGYAAFWLVREGRGLVEQPVVFLGSEGETGVIARDLADFLWLLAGGVGPWEAAAGYGSEEGELRPDPAREAVAERFASRRRGPAGVVADAGAEFPGFDEELMGLTR
ncbi:SMI1/KNR4 family protein [Streptomyces sp. IpFD-1.1]|uniref:SMI1/KNR4 family protein n=1 Tax=Streptomyces sp. IpFD-1.1 TaxID=2841664 RepID=UPI002094F9E4|nr:SMI1/KNR4 family protein [Streptomyces sp. IpFD-1.1]MCO6749779.1 SMI1/KNR4 family protein [Streptomyces sp. IpFD-1.1]